MNVGIYIYDEAEVLDFSGPFEVFSVASRFLDKDEKFNVSFISESKEIINARGGYKVISHYNIDNHPPLDILIVVGGKKILIYERTKTSSDKVQYFTMHEAGIGRVYDSRKGGRYYSGTGFKFPAGYGWKLNERRIQEDTVNYRDSRYTDIEITSMSFNSDGELESIIFDWYVDDMHDHTYTYEVNKGLIKAERQ